MKAVIDDNCIGCGLCESIAAEVFEMGDEGKAHVIKAELSADDTDAVQEAVDSCPTQAISISE